MNKARKQNKDSSFGKTTPDYALIYCRVSSERQKNEGHGLESQEARCREFSKHKNLKVDAVFADTATGGGRFEDNRKGQVEIIKRIDQYPFRRYAVVIDDLSRIARDTKAYLSFKEALKNRGVEFMSPNFQFDDTPEGEYIETVVSAGNELQKKVNRRQVIQKMRARLEAGYWCFGGKKGYKMIQNPIHGKLAVPHHEEAEVLKNALEGFSTGKFVRKLDACIYLVENNFWKGQRPERYIDKFDSFLRDPFYCGYIEYLMWEVERRIGKHEAIISLDTFEQNQKRLSKRDLNKIRIDHSEEFVLRGLVICDECVGHLTAAWAKGRNSKHGYYFCQNGKCSNYRKSIKMENVEGEFGSILKKYQLKTEVSKVIEVVFNKVWKEEVLLIENQEKQSKKEKGELEQKAKQLTEIIIESKSSRLKQLYEGELEKIAERLDRLDNEKIESVDLSIPYRTALQKSTKFLKNPYIAWEKSSPVEKQQLYYFIFDQKLRYNIKSGYRTAEIPTAIRLFEDFVITKSHDVEMGRLNSRPDK